MPASGGFFYSLRLRLRYLVRIKAWVVVALVGPVFLAPRAEFTTPN